MLSIQYWSRSHVRQINRWATTTPTPWLIHVIKIGWSERCGGFSVGPAAVYSSGFLVVCILETTPTEELYLRNNGGGPGMPALSTGMGTF